MRIVVRVTLGVLAAMIGTLLAIGIAAGPATAAPAVSSHVQVAVVHTGVVHVATPKTPVTTAPTTDYNKGQQAANAALAKRKLILGVICVVLLGIVYLGHRAKGKHILRVKNLQNAKS
ncbi:MAG TPA: hypothetical protein VFX16_12590 [Pseudonocardiaceae bacterium]|nr:hypothetical protein [Pseudonocardiaceae bacterium]